MNSAWSWGEVKGKQQEREPSHTCANLTIKDAAGFDDMWSTADAE